MPLCEPVLRRMGKQDATLPIQERVPTSRILCQRALNSVKLNYPFGAARCCPNGPHLISSEIDLSKFRC